MKLMTKWWFYILWDFCCCCDCSHDQRANVLQFYGFMVLNYIFWKCMRGCLTSLKNFFLMLSIFPYSSLSFSLFRRRLGTINQIQCLCVLESDFGFSINCNFKNSGLFRVRNLGGVKAHFGLGKEKKNLSKAINKNAVVKYISKQ